MGMNGGSQTVAQLFENGNFNVAGALETGGGLIVGGNVIKASDGGSTITMDTSDNVTIAGDLTVSGGKLTFGNNEFISNETDDFIQMKSNDDKMLLIIQSSADNQDSGIILYEGATPRWSMQQDASDNSDYSLVWDYNTVTAGGATKMDLDSTGNLGLAGRVTASGFIYSNPEQYSLGAYDESRSLSPNDLGFSLAGLGDVVATLIADLQSVGVITTS